MKKHLIPAILILIAAVIGAFAVLALPGCSQTPTQQLYDAQVSFDAVVSGLDAAHAAGALSTADEAKLAPYVEAVNAAIQSLQTAVTAKDQNGIDVALKAVDAAMQAFSQAQANLKPPAKP